MSILKDMIDRLAELGARQAAVKPVKVDAEPDFVYGIHDPTTNKIEWRQATPKPRDNKGLSLQPIIDFAVENAKTAEIWYSRQAVMCFLDRNTRRDRVTLPLKLSEPLIELMKADEALDNLEQKELILLLRTTFAGCVSSSVVKLLRQLKFAVGSSGESSVQHGKSSVGKQIQSEVSGQESLPEELTFDVPIFANAFPGIRQKIEVAVDIHSDTARFDLIPLPNEIENAIEEAEATIAKMIVDRLAESEEGKDVPVFYGSP